MNRLKGGLCLSARRRVTWLRFCMASIVLLKAQPADRGQGGLRVLRRSGRAWEGYGYGYEEEMDDMRMRRT